MQWFRYIIGKKISIKCANVLPVLRDFFCFQAIILCQFNFLQFYKFKKLAFVTVQVFQFSVFWIRSYANRTDKQFCISKKWNFGFGQIIRILDYYWQKQNYVLEIVYEISQYFDQQFYWRTIYRFITYAIFQTVENLVSTLWWVSKFSSTN